MRKLRQQVGLSETALAERADISLIELARIESGTEDPAWGTVRRIAEGLGVPLEALAEAAEES